jgi:TonB family protein
MNFAVAFALTFAAADDAKQVVTAPSIRAPKQGYTACYSASALYGREGRVLVEVIIEPDGSVGKVVFPIGTEPWQQDTAHCILKRALITPGTVDGKPVSAQAVLPINFSLADEFGNAAKFDGPKLLSEPGEVEDAYRACYPEDMLAMQTAHYRLTIGTNGRARNIKLIESGGDVQLDEAGICVIQKLQFKPTQRDGEAVTSTITLPLKMRPAR